MKIVLAFVITVANAFLAPAVLQDGWRWFVSPVFNVPALSYGTAFGLWMFRSLMVMRLYKHEVYHANIRETYKDDEVDISLYTTIQWFFMLLFEWGLFALTHYFIG